MYAGHLPTHTPTFVAGGTAATAASLPYTGAAVLVTFALGAALLMAGLLVLRHLKRRQQG